MSSALKCMRLDYLLLKPYVKSILLVLLVPMIFPFFTGTLFEGLSFAATIMAMTTGYTFSVAEKNSLDRFYGFLPAKRSNLVIGRYAVIYLLGVLALLITTGVQTVVLHFMGVALTLPEIVGTFLLCAALFSVYAGVQIPGYYRFGSIKGKMFMFVPTVGFLLFYFAVGKLMGETGGTVSFRPNSALLLACGACAIVFVIALSAAISVRVVKKNRD